jgi:hypothetical protein
MLRMTNWIQLVILRTEGTKNLGFAFVVAPFMGLLSKLLDKSSNYKKEQGAIYGFPNYEEL